MAEIGGMIDARRVSIDGLLGAWRAAPALYITGVLDPAAVPDAREALRSRGVTYFHAVGGPESSGWFVTRGPFPPCRVRRRIRLRGRAAGVGVFEVLGGEAAAGWLREMFSPACDTGEVGEGGIRAVEASGDWRDLIGENTTCR